MIIVEEILTNPSIENKTKDVFEIEWYECAKTIIRRATKCGIEVAIKKNNKTPLQDGDVLWMDDARYIAIAIRPCECIVVTPAALKEMGIICFEIGNRHIPIYIDDDNNISVAYEAPLYTWLQGAGYKPCIEMKKLLKTHQLRMHGK